MLTKAANPPLRWNPLSRIPLPLAGGLLFGWLLAYFWMDLEGKWLFYIALGILTASALPVLAVVITGLDRFFLWLFLFSQQAFLSFNFVVADRPMPGGPQGLQVSLQFLLAVLYFVAWKTREHRDPDDVRSIHPRFLRACLWLLVLISFSFFNTTTKSYTVYGYFYYIGLVTTALAACHICSTRHGLESLWNAMWSITIIQCLVLLVQRVFQVSFSLTGEVIDSAWTDRFGGTMGIAPVSSASLLMGLVLFAEMRILRGDDRTLLKWGPAFGLAFLCLLLSLTRSAWFGCAIGSFAVIGWCIKHGGITLFSGKRGMALLAVAFVGLIVAYRPVRDRLDANHQHAADERWRLNFVNLEMIKAHPVIGIGLNTVYDSKTRYLPSFFDEGDWIYIAHNQYLLIAAEAGLISLFAFIRVLWITIMAAANGARAPDRLIGETGAVLYGYLMAFVWGMFLDFYGGMQVYILLWFIFGCAAGVQMLTLREEAAAKHPAEALASAAA